MHRHLVGAAALTAMVLAPGGGLRAAAPGSGGEAASLIGKTCQGVFNNGKHQQVSRGALQLQLASENGQVVGHLWRQFGKEAHDQAEYAMTQRHFIGLEGFQDLGMVRDLSLAGKEIHFTDAIGVKFALTYTGGGLFGQGDPRGGSDPRMTVVASVSMICQ